MIRPSRTTRSFSRAIPCAAVLAQTLAFTLALAQETPPDVLKIDFEQGADLSKYPMIKPTEGLETTVVPRADGEGHCLRVRNTKPSVYCTVSIARRFTAGRDMAISLDHREAIEDGQMRYDAGACYGCGLCVVVCPGEATVMQRRPHT